MTATKTRRIRFVFAMVLPGILNCMCTASDEANGGPTDSGDTGVDSASEPESESDGTDTGLGGLVSADCRLDYAPAAFVGYDVLGEQISSLRLFYDAEGRLASVSEDVNSPPTIEYTYEYDDTLVGVTGQEPLRDRIYTIEYSADGKTATADLQIAESGVDTVYKRRIFEFENGRTVRYVMANCAAENLCEDVQFIFTYEYNVDGLLTEVTTDRGPQYTPHTRYFEYSDTGRLLRSFVYIDDLPEDDVVYEYENDRLIRRTRHNDGTPDVVTSYTYENGRVARTDLSQGGIYMLYEWTEDATACDLLENWFFRLLYSDLGDSPREMILRIYGEGEPVGAFL